MISIGKKWRIGIDELNVTIYRFSEPKAGQERKGDGWKAVAYYPTVTNGGRDPGIIMALHHIADVDALPANDIELIWKRQDELHKEIQGVKAEVCKYLDCRECFKNVPLEIFQNKRENESPDPVVERSADQMAAMEFRR